MFLSYAVVKTNIRPRISTVHKYHKDQGPKGTSRRPKCKGSTSKCYLLEVTEMVITELEPGLTTM
jgi:hypothetical protein